MAHCCEMIGWSISLSVQEEMGGELVSAWWNFNQRRTHSCAPWLIWQPPNTSGLNTATQLPYNDINYLL